MSQHNLPKNAALGIAVVTLIAMAAPVAPALAGDIPEMVVTATGFGTPRKTHAGNISKISADDIAQTHAEQPAELLNRLPGLNIEQGSGVEHLTAIRSPVLSGGAGAGSFLYLEDGVPMRAAGFGNVNALMDAMTEEAAGIEVIRGPASARYGSNAVHGLINVLSAPPSLEPEAELTTWFGAHDILHLQGTASTSIIDGDETSGIRGSFALEHDGGARARSGYDQQKAQLRYDYNHLDKSLSATFNAVNLNQETAGYVSSYTDDAIRKSNPDPEAYRDAWAIRTAIRLEQRYDDKSKLVLTPYARNNAMNFLMHFQTGRPVEENAHKSIGLLSSYFMPIGKAHSLIIGLDSEMTDGRLSEIQESPTTGTYVTGTHYDYTVQALVIAPYLHSVWQLTPSTQMTTGARFEFTRYDYHNQASTGITGRFLRAADSIDTFSDFTPKLGFTQIFNDSVTGFLNLARGSRAPQTTDMYRLQSKQTPGEAKSEKIDSLEIGARGRIGALSYETAFFAMKKRNFYFRDADGFNVSDGKTNHLGIETEVSAPLFAGFDIAGSATYARHTYDFDNIVTILSNSTEAIHKGDDVDTAPRTIASMRLGYDFADGQGRGELEWVHMGAYWMDASNTVRYPGHDIFNLRMNCSLNENITLFGKATNLFDKRYADRADYFFSTARYFPGDGRGFEAGLTLRF